MAFCTKCGASVAGAFCNQCGTATGLAAPAPAPAAVPSRRKTSPIVWVLLIVLGFCILGILGLVGTGIFLAKRGPGYALAKLIAANNPNMEVIHSDDGARTITLRDRRTGKTVTMNFDDVRNGRFRMEAEDEQGKTATVEFGGLANLPSWVPSYPGSHPQPLFSASGESDSGSGEAGNFLFTTSDAISKVASFYQDEGKRLGMEVEVRSGSADARIIVLTDHDSQRSLTVVTGSSDGKTTVNVTYGRKR